MSGTPSSSSQQPPPPNPGAWKAAVVRRIFNVTLDPQDSVKSGYKLTYLPELADELRAEGQGRSTTERLRSLWPSADTSLPYLIQPLATPRLDPTIADRALIARLSIDPASSPMTEDDVLIKSIQALDKDHTSWDYLIACWKRCSKEIPKAKKVSEFDPSHSSPSTSHSQFTQHSSRVSDHSPRKLLPYSMAYQHSSSPTQDYFSQPRTCFPTTQKMVRPSPPTYSYPAFSTSRAYPLLRVKPPPVHHGRHWIKMRCHNSWSSSPLASMAMD